MAKIIEVLHVLRNNWKKTVLGSGLLVYGVNYGREQYEIQNLMRQYCEDALKFGDDWIPVGVRPRHLTVILNPAANKRKAKTQFEKYCAPLLHLSGVSVEILVTEASGQARTFADTLDCSKTDGIVVAGGDGTLSEVVTGLMRRKMDPARTDKCDVAVGILPLGRTNSLARSLYSFPPSETIVTYHMAEASMAVIRGHTKSVHALKIEVLDKEEEEEEEEEVVVVVEEEQQEEEVKVKTEEDDLTKSDVETATELAETDIEKTAADLAAALDNADERRNSEEVESGGGGGSDFVDATSDNNSANTATSYSSDASDSVSRERDDSDDSENSDVVQQIPMIEGRELDERTPVTEAKPENVSNIFRARSVNSGGDNEGVKNGVDSDVRKPVYSLSSVEWGTFRDTRSKRDKYWYFGPLRNYVAYLFNRPTAPYSGSIIFTAPCSGCSRCYAERSDLHHDEPKKRWWHIFVPRRSQPAETEELIDYSTVHNHACGSFTEIKLHTMDLSLTTANVDPSTTAVNINIGPEKVSWLTYIEEGWKREWGAESILSSQKQSLQAQSVQIRPASSSTAERWLSIDNEDFEMRPISVTLIHNSLRMFYPKEREEERKKEMELKAALEMAEVVKSSGETVAEISMTEEQQSGEKRNVDSSMNEK